MFTVQGFRTLGDRDVPYAVVIDGEGDPLVGKVTGGSDVIASAVALDHGRKFFLEPVGPEFTLDKDEPWSIYAWLGATTRVTDVEGEIPEDPDRDDDDAPEGAVF